MSDERHPEPGDGLKDAPDGLPEQSASIDDPLIGSAIGNYTISSVLGRGGFGTVYKAHDAKLGRDAAVKFLHEVMDEDHRRLFEREAKVIAALGKQPSIVQIHEWGERHGRIYFVLEYVASSVTKLLEESPEGLPVATALRITKECAEALAYAHERGILHRDIKPANILIEAEDGRAKLADFGLAKFLGTGDQTRTGTIGGSPSYMAPEQALGDPVDARTDVFSLGVTLYEMLSGRRPYEASMHMQILYRLCNDDRVPLRERRPDLAFAVLSIVERATAHSPSERFQSAAEMAVQIAAVLEGREESVESGPAEQEPGTPGAQSRLRRPGKRVPAQLVCASCNGRFVSAQSLTGQCAECGEGICYKCWAQGKRTCVKHERAERPDIGTRREPPKRFGAARGTKLGPKCDNCGKELPRGRLKDTDTAYCADCQEELARIPDKLPEGAVTVEEARYLESLFHEFMQDALARLDKWPAPPHQPRRRFEKARFWHIEPLSQSLLRDHPFRTALEKRLERLPGNECVAINLEYRSHAPWRRDALSIELALLSVAPLHTLVEQGYLDEPGGAHALNLALESLDYQEANLRLVCVFSATGWSESLAIPDGTVLVGPSADGGWETRINVRDEALRTFVETLFDTESVVDKFGRCIEAILDQSPDKYPLSARRVAEELGEPGSRVAEAFRRIASERENYTACEDPEKDDWVLDMK